MAKDILAFLGMVFLVILIVLGVASLAFFYDRVGIIEFPDEFRQAVEDVVPSRTITVGEVGVGEAEWTNPLDAIPTSTMTPVPTPTITPVPPMDPELYETEVILRLKSFVSALERWLELNEALTSDNDLIDDTAWQSEMSFALNNVAKTSRSLAEVGPPPPEYEDIDQWLDRVALEAEGLYSSYREALDSRENPEASSRAFTTASEHFVRVKEYLFQAVEKMIAAGWSF